MKYPIKLDCKVKRILQSNKLKAFSKLKIRRNRRFGKEYKNFLHLACKYSKIALVKYCIEELKIDILSKTRNENISFHYACAYGTLNLVKFLFQSNPKVLNMRNKKKQTPLLLAAKNSHEDICMFLIKKGAHINAQDRQGFAVGHWAAAFNMKSLLHLLYEKTYNFSLENLKKENALHFAAWSGDIECFEYIFQFVSINLASIKGNIGYYCKGNWKLLQWILEMKYIKARSLGKTVFFIGTPLEIFEKCGIKYGVAEALSFDRDDLVHLLYRNREICAEDLYWISEKNVTLQEKCKKYIESLWKWSRVCPLLFVYKNGNNKISSLPNGIFRDLMRFVMLK